MNRDERRARVKEQAKAAAALHKRARGAESAKEALAIAQRLFQLGKAKEALPVLREAVASHPDDADLRGAFAYALASTGEVLPAIEQYRAVLDAKPDAVPILTNLAMLLTRTGYLDEARVRLERASELSPHHANTAFALAEVLGKQGQGREAFHHYRRAASLFRQKVGPHPGIEHCDDLVKLATAQMWTGDLKPALRNFDLAVELRPDHALALARRGMALVKLRRFPEAITTFRRAAAMQPDIASVRRALGSVLLSAGDAGAAATHLRAATNLDPSDELARYFLAAAKHERPDAPPPSYVQSLFDEYAHAFDRHLVDTLQYRAPEQVCSALLELAGTQPVHWRVIDLGCGTGLCGPLIRRAASHLVGVDLSAQMLEKAREKSVYDELRHGDVVAVLGEYTEAFDVAICADVMIYLGSLTPIFAAASRALAPGALFAFTTEVHSGEGFVVDTSARYLYSRRYVEHEATSHGFAVVRLEQIVARYQNSAPVVEDFFIVRRCTEAS